MAATSLKLAALGCLASGMAWADCTTQSFDPPAAFPPLAVPAAPDPELKPVRPACLADITSPEQESCPRDVLAAYAAQIDAWVAALNAYVVETNAYANAAAERANAAVDHALGARAFADAALDYANCEAAEINRLAGE